MPFAALQFVVVLVALWTSACGAAVPQVPRVSLQTLRDRAAGSDDPDVVGRWLLGETWLPDGDAARAKEARKKLDSVTKAGDARMFGALARLVDDEAHGRFKSAATAGIEALKAARSSDHPDAPLVAWYAANELYGLRTSVADLWNQAKDTVSSLLKDPGSIGWRARSELVDWWTIDGFDPAAPNAEKDPLEKAANEMGCVRKARLAGPFGHRASADMRTHFDAERAGPWPLTFAKDPLSATAPRVLKTERRGCLIQASEPVENGVFYVETFVKLPADREVIVAAQAALALWVDDTEVLTRDPKQWGIWPRYGARLRLREGRHRILARVNGAETAIRILSPTGTPIEAEISDDPSAAYQIVPPVVLPDPNPLTPFLAAAGVPGQPGTPLPASPRDTDDPLSRFLAASIAHVDGGNDVAAVLIADHTEDLDRATGPTLATLAIFTEKDPIYSDTDTQSRAKDLRTRAAKKDPDLWWPQMWLALDEADKSGAAEATTKMTELAARFREVPAFPKALASMYEQLGWNAERARTIEDAAARFPDDLDLLPDLLVLHEERGNFKGADEVAAHIERLDPDAEIAFARALSKRDYKGAITELRKLGDRRRDRRDIAIRIADLLVRAGQSSETMEKLERTLAKNPTDASARLSLADARFATGDKSALRKALVEAIETGSDADALRDAEELIDGTNELAPYRIDAKQVIAAYEASKVQMPGTAARVLDYAALWVHADGSARMLEHEIICVQSREAIQELAEQRLNGVPLRIRTIKHNGQVFEPEFVRGKPTVTMPHLDVGDYIETEVILHLGGDGRGRMFEGPRWLFREEKVPYYRSEFVVISPKSKPLDVETGGTVPAPQLTEAGALIVRRWRVDQSPALPEEPGSAPIAEFLPNVRVGWGINLTDTIARLVDAAADETPRDPRLILKAKRIVAGLEEPEESEDATKSLLDDPKPKPKAKATGGSGSSQGLGISEAQANEISGLSKEEIARRVYRWVVSNVEPNREGDGRRIVMGRSGNPTEAFLYLCRLLNVDVAIGLVRDRLAPPPRGPMSEAETFGGIAVRVRAERDPIWLVVHDKFTPFGYLPSGLRGQPAVVLVPGAPRETTSKKGASDSVRHEGVAVLAEDGSASVVVTQKYDGKLAIGLRALFETLPEAQIREVVESRLLPRSLPGALLESFDVKDAKDPDKPLTLSVKVRMPNFAKPRRGGGGQELILTPPFALRLNVLASLPVRETPLYISENMATLLDVSLRVKLPEGAKVTTTLSPWSGEHGGRAVDVKDQMDGADLMIRRRVDIPAGRVQPEDYRDFQTFVRGADAAILRDITISLR